MPYLPGGGQRQAEVLRAILTAVDAAGGLTTAMVDLGDGDLRTIREAIKQIAPAGMIQVVDRATVAVVDDARAWLDGDDFALIATFHRHVRFVGEMLAALADGPLTTREVNE